jgi:hypothetical protein
MYKLMTLAAVLVVLALAPVLTGMSAAEAPQPMRGMGGQKASEPAGPAELASPDELLACEWSCRACKAEEGCRQLCTETGDCGSTCGVMAQCDAQHAWREDACACVLR